MHLLERMGSLSAGFFFASLILITAWGIGEILLALLFGRSPRREEDVIASTVLGLGMIGEAVYLVAWQGLFSRYLVFALIAAGTAAALWRAREFKRPVFSLPLWPALPAIIAIAATIGSPPVFWDTLSYHFAIPDFIVSTGTFPDNPAYIFGFYPVAMESIYAAAFAFPYGETTAHWLNIVALILAAQAAVSGLSHSDRRLGHTIILTTPGLVMLAYAPKNASMAALAGLIAVVYAARRRSEDASSKSCFLAGAALGTAAATHLVSLVLFPIVILLSTARRGIRSAVTIFASAIALSFPVFLRNLLLTGNPVYPYASSLFNNSDLATRTTTLPETYVNMEIIAGLKNFALPFIDIEPLGIGSTLGLSIPVGILLAAYFSRQFGFRSPLLHAAIGIALLFVGAAFLRTPRFLIVGFFLAVPVAAEGLGRSPALAKGLLLVQSLMAAAYLLFCPLYPAQTLMGTDPDQYAARYNPAHMLARYADDHLPRSAKVASAGILRSYGWHGRLELASEHYQPILQSILDEHSDSETAIIALKSLGYGFIAVDFAELSRLQKQYSFLIMTADKKALYHEILRESRKLKSFGSAGLYQLP